MDFWGVEVVAGKALDVEVEDSCYLHVSHAALGEIKGGKGADERVVLRAHVDKQEVVLGTLVPGKCDQISFDLIFDRNFKLSHNSKVHSVYFCGYTSESAGEEPFSSEDEEEEDEFTEEKLPVEKEPKVPEANGKPAKDKKANAPVTLDQKAVLPQDLKKAGSKVALATVAVPPQDLKKAGLKVAAGEESAKKAEKKKPNDLKEEDDEDDEDDIDEDDEDEEEEEDEDESDDEEDDEGEDEEDDEEDEDMDDLDDQLEMSDDSEQETPSSKLKKRAKPSATVVEAPQSGKKQKLNQAKLGAETVKPGVISTPAKKSGEQKTTAVSSAKEQKAPTSTPSKTPGKQSSTANETKTPKQQNTPGSKKSPGTLGQYVCAACSRNFTTESGLSQHKSAKHKGE